jgi:hypothetical protein
MTTASATLTDFAKVPPSKAGLSAPQIGAINAAIVLKIKEIYSKDTVKTLASWLRLSFKTAKNRLDEERQFSLDEVGELLGSEHGFQILTAIMNAAAQRPGYRVPDWWAVCEPLMDLADAERLCEAVRRRTDKAIRKREDVVDALEQEIRRTQTLAIHSPEQARVRLNALQSYAGADRRVVAPKGAKR